MLMFERRTSFERDEEIPKKASHQDCSGAWYRVRMESVSCCIQKMENVSVLFRVMLLYALLNCLNVCVSSEIAHGYDTEEYTLAVINITYFDGSTIRTEEEEIGKFSFGKVEPVSGVVVHVSSNNHTSYEACDVLDTDNIPHEPWIALVKYGRCRDNTKLRFVAQTNASAAVVYSNQAGSRLIKMYPKAPHLVSVFTTKEKGEKIARLADNGTRVMMYIFVGTHNKLRYTNINRTSVLFVSISFIILMLISLAWLIFYYIQRFRYIHTKDMLARRLSNAAKRALDKIPTRALRQDDKEISGEFECCCAVCIEPFKTGEVVRTLPCSHTFHKLCIDPWLLNQRSCPMCKLDILKYYGLVFTCSRESIFNFDDAESHARAGLGHIRVPIYRSSSSSPSAQGRNFVSASSFPLSSSIAIVDSISNNPACSSVTASSGSPVSSLQWKEEAEGELLPMQNSWSKEQHVNEQSTLNSAGTSTF